MSRSSLSRDGSYTLMSPAAVVLMLGVIGGCSTEVPRRASEQSLAARLTTAAASRSLSLLIVPLADTIRVGESAELAVLVVNGGDSAVRFRNTAEYFYYDVRGPTGAPVRPENLSEPPQLGPVPDTWLPAGGVLGRVVNIRCLHAGVRNYRPGGAGCELSFVLRDRGPYQIKVVYVLPRARGDAVGADTTLVSNTAKVSVM